MKIVKKVLRWLFVIPLAAAALAALAVLFVETRLGKMVLASVAARAASGALGAELRIGRVSGNLFSSITLSDLELFDGRGGALARVAKARGQLRLESVMPLRLVIRELQIEQPRVWLARDSGGRWNWSIIFKRKGGDTKPEKEKEDGGESWIQFRNVKLVEGYVNYLGPRGEKGELVPVNIDIGLPRKFERLPEGRVLARGRLAGLPLKIAASAHGLVPAALPGRLSGVAKRPFDAQSFALVVKWGASQLEVTAEGELKPNDWGESNAMARIERLHYDGREAKRRITELSGGIFGEVFDAKVYGELTQAKLRAGVEAHVGGRGKILLEGSAFEEGTSKFVRLERARFQGECPLLELRRPGVLRFNERDPIPYGKLELKGCAGRLEYERSDKGLFARVTEVAPGPLLKALALRIPQLEYSKIHALVELPRGPRIPIGQVEAGFTFRVPEAAETAATTVLARAEMKGRNLVANLTMALGEEKLVASADIKKFFQNESWLPDRAAANGKVRLEAQEFNLARLQEAGLFPTGIDGKLSARLAASGSLQKATGSFVANGARIGIATGKSGRVDARTPRLDVTFEADYDARALRLKGQARPVSEGRVSAPLEWTGRATLPQAALLRDIVKALRDAPLEWGLRSKELDVAQLLSIVRYPSIEQEKLWVGADIDARGSGTIRRPAARANVTLRGRQGELASLAAGVDGESLRGTLKANAVSSDELLTLLTNEARTEQGVFTADLKVSGTIFAPSYGGFAQVKAPRFRLPKLGTSYQDLSVRLTGDQRRLVLEELSVKSGGGWLKAKGTAALEDPTNPEAVKLDAELSNFQALASESLRIEGTGKLALHSSHADSRFGGTFEVSEGSVTIPEKGGKDVESLSPLEDVVSLSELEQKKRRKRGLFERAHGEIDVHAPGRFWVKSKSGDIAVELQAELVAGLDDEGEPFVKGTVDAVRGSVEFFGRFFEIRHSLVEFRGDPKDPRVNAEAYYRSSPWSILVAVKGNVKNLKPQLTSEPPGLSEEEAIGVLLVGDPNFQRSGGGGGRSVTGVATGFLAGELKRKLGPKLPIDTLRADIGTDREQATHPSDEDRSRIEVGKYVTDRAFVKLGRIFAVGNEDAINELTLDYRLSDRWSIETAQTDTGRTDLQILWTVNY